MDAAQAEVDRGARAADSLRASNRALAAELRGAITELRASRAHGVGQEGGRAEGRGAADGVKGDRRRVEGGTNAGGWGVWGEDGSRDMGRGATSGVGLGSLCRWRGVGWGAMEGFCIVDPTGGSSFVPCRRDPGGLA